jgi:hypothetical protein
MSNAQIDLASCLIRLKYGSELGHLVTVMGGADFITLAQIQLRVSSYPGPVHVKLKSKEIGYMLGILVWHKYAEFRKINNRANYKLRLPEIIRILQYPRYLYHIHELFEERGASIIENILLHGMQTQHKCVFDQLTANHTDEDVYQINGVFSQLVATNFISKEPNLATGTELSEIPEFIEMSEQDKFDVITAEGLSQGATQSQCPDQKGLTQYWSINTERFQRYIRDQLIVEDAAEMFGTKPATLLRNALRVSEDATVDLPIEHPISYIDIRRACDEASMDFNNGMNFDATLAILVSGAYLNKTHEGLYSINIRQIISRCFKNSVLQWIMTKYGVEARKVVALLQDQQYYEPHIVAKKCLIDEKVARRVIYRKGYSTIDVHLVY